MSRLTALLFAIGLSGTGCATLTVDVDVYKGPLSAEDIFLQTDSLIGAVEAAAVLNSCLQFDPSDPRHALKERLLDEFQPTSTSTDSVAAQRFLTRIDCGGEDRQRPRSGDEPEEPTSPTDEVPTATGQDTQPPQSSEAASARTSRPTYADRLSTMTEFLKDTECKGSSAAGASHASECRGKIASFAQSVATMGQMMVQLSTLGAEPRNDETGFYLRALQAMGDAIQASANEIQRTATNDRLLLGTAGFETQEVNRLTQNLDGLAAPPRQSPSAPDLDARLAVDRAIRFLMYERIRILAGGQVCGVAEGGKAKCSGTTFTPEANRAAAVGNLDRAIQAAFERRGLMANLKPASAYLRTSASTLFQHRDHLHSRNMLDDQLLKLVPDWMRLPSTKKLQRQLESADALSWQNVNRIRVTGVGDVNYVVAKDDIGNWYVKDYSTDVTDIVNSATGLAMYGFGGPATALAGGSTQEGDASQNETGAGAAQQSRQAAQVARFQTVFASRTRRECTDMGVALEALPNKIEGLLEAAETAGGGGATAFSEAVAASEIRALLLGRGDLSCDDDGVFETGDRIRQAVESVRSFGAGAAAAIRATSPVTRLVGAEAAAEANVETQESLLEAAQEGRSEALQALSNGGAANRAVADVLTRHATQAAEAIQAREEAFAASRTAWEDAKKSLAAAREAEAFALRVVEDETDAVALRAVQRRLRTLEDYRTAVSVIGDLEAAE